jgi:pimeloyl-ACP methyl ester carboxylesterase
MRWITSGLFALLIPFFAGVGDVAFAQKVDPPLDIYLTPQTLATLPDGRHIHLFCMGTGQPVAIVAPGWHIPALGWNRIQPSMAKQTKVCIYDRAGYSFSDPGPMPRDTAAEVKDLHDALDASGIKGPYILVGHSLGGFDARLFAYTYPKETAGLLLLDPPTERIYQRTREPDEDVALMRHCADLVRKAPITFSDKCLENGIQLGPRWSAAMRAKVLADQNHASWFETLVSEDMSMVTRSSDELVAAHRPLGSIPIIVLQADTDCAPKQTPKAEAKSFDAERCAELLSQARDSTRGYRRIVAGATHMVQDDKPKVVLGAFSEIVKASRSSGLATAEPN